MSFQNDPNAPTFDEPEHYLWRARQRLREADDILEEAKQVCPESPYAYAFGALTAEYRTACYFFESLLRENDEMKLEIMMKEADQ